MNINARSFNLHLLDRRINVCYVVMNMNASYYVANYGS